MNALKVGLVGIGGIGQRHRECLVDLQNPGLLQSVAAADPVLEKELTLRVELEAGNVRCYGRQTSMIEADLDSVVLAAPISLCDSMA